MRHRSSPHHGFYTLNFYVYLTGNVAPSETALWPTYACLNILMNSAQRSALNRTIQTRIYARENALQPLRAVERIFCSFFGSLM